MKSLIGVLCCIIVSKVLAGVTLDNLVIQVFVNYYALVLGCLGSLYFVAMFIYDTQS